MNRIGLSLNQVLKKERVQVRRFNELESNVIRTGLGWTAWGWWEIGNVDDSDGSKLYRLLATSSSFISGTASNGRRQLFLRVSISPYGTGDILPVEIGSKNDVILASSAAVLGFSIDRKSRANCDVIESRQRGIVVTCGDYGKLVSWDIETTNILNDFKGHMKGFIVRSCEISNDGKTLVSASEDKTIRVWDVRTGNCLKVLNGHTSVVSDE